MHFRRSLLAVGLVTLLALPFSKLPAQDEETSETFTAAVIEIQEALARAESDILQQRREQGGFARGPVLKTATVRLQTTVSTKVRPGVQLVVGASGERQKTQTEEIVLTLTPRGEAQWGAVAPSPFSDDLVAAIKTAYAAAQASMDAAPYLEVTSFEVHLGLVARTNVEGGITFEVPSIKVGVEGQRTEASVHRITLVFAG